MRSVWRLLGLAAALNITLGAAPAAAQRVMVRNLPAGTPVEVILNADTVGSGTIAGEGDVTIPFTLPEKDGKAEMDANIYLDVCEKIRRVLIVDRNRAAAPVAAGCDRREISGLFWVRRSNTIVIDAGQANPTLLLINGNYTPPKPEDLLAEGESRPSAPLPKGFVMFAAGGSTKFRDFLLVQCGNASPCSGDERAPSYSFGATLWLTRYFGVEGSYLKPRNLKISGGDTFTFNTKLDVDIWSVVGKLGVQAGPARIYGQGGTNYHQATITTNETIESATQKVETQTKGWNWVYGGGLEIWIKRKVAIYGEFDRAWVKGNATGGGEAEIDERATTLLLGVRLHVGG